MIEGILGVVDSGKKKLTSRIVKRKPPRKTWILGAILFAIVPVLLWYSRPSLDGTKFGDYIDKGVTWWNSLEGWALTGDLAPSAFAAPPASKHEEEKPTTSVEPESTPTPLTDNNTKVKIISIPAGASLTINGEASGTTPMIYAAKPQEKRIIKFEAPDFEPLEIERTAPAAA